jgi:SAM-dependent methyltransferase
MLTANLGFLHAWFFDGCRCDAGHDRQADRRSRRATVGPKLVPMSENADDPTFGPPAGVDFNEATARMLERMYSTPEVALQRALVLHSMALRAGEVVLDVGPGPGFLARDMAAIVGPSGVVSGIDQSEPMVAMARERCSEQDWVDIQIGEATDLPYQDGVFDAAVSTQVYEYVEDVDAALIELYRVLRPGGRAFIVDTDWGSVVWNNSDLVRHRRVLEAWDEHLVHPHLPASLTPRLKHAGFQIVRRDVNPMFNPEYSPDSYSAGILEGIQAFVPGHCGLTQADADAWASDLRTLGEAGDYFFSVNRYLFMVVKPGRPSEG